MMFSFFFLIIPLSLSLSLHDETREANHLWMEEITSSNEEEKEES